MLYPVFESPSNTTVIRVVEESPPPHSDVLRGMDWPRHKADAATDAKANLMALELEPAVATGEIHAGPARRPEAGKTKALGEEPHPIKASGAHNLLNMAK
mmetsp:Transcript_114389/g.220276  ORF Transcript_114389/g.220276 Transcript_114389/m.220276 type:complete len:100 (+) Transcript_114389:25-324(+)